VNLINRKGGAVENLKPQKNLGRIPRYTNPNMPTWIQVVIGFALGIVVGYCWAYNALQGGC